jgi:4-hydroxy-3-polyprenylbenzoate decarboxylase
MLKAKLSDIMVPADAEIVLEGHIYSGDMAEEGPFAWVSYYTPKVQNSVYSVELISQRKDPILPFVAEGLMSSDTVNIYSVLHSRDLMDFGMMMGLPLRYVTLPVEAKLCLAIASLAYQPRPGFPYRVARLFFGMSPFVRTTIVLDGDVDPEDLGTALGDVCAKAHPIRDFHIADKMDTTLSWAENHDWDTGLTSTLAINATFRMDKEPETIPKRVLFEFTSPVEVQKAVLEKWNRIVKTPPAWTYRKD